MAHFVLLERRVQEFSDELARQNHERNIWLDIEVKVSLALPRTRAAVAAAGRSPVAPVAPTDQINTSR